MIRRFSSRIRNGVVLTTKRDQGAAAWKSFASVDPWDDDLLPRGGSVKNLVAGSWVTSLTHTEFPDPLTGCPMLRVAEITTGETKPFIDSLGNCPKSGLHNPLKDPQRYLQYGNISAVLAAKLRDPSIMAFFTKLIQRVAPKSQTQAWGEVAVTQKFIENFGGDQVRFLARSFAVPGDHPGQISAGYRWPYGPVVIIAPFNFPMEIPVLQLMGALYMGNKVLLKVDSKVSVVMEQILRLMHECGLPSSDVDFINCDGAVMHNLLLKAQPRMTQFTGSSRVAEILARDLHGKIKIEDAGFNWKVLGPDVGDVDFVAYTCDQDAYAFSGQKCSAQSALFVHENWDEKWVDIVSRLKTLAARRTLSDLTVGPILTVTNQAFREHLHALLKIPGARLEFGGKELSGHNIPACYGAWEPTAVSVPINKLLMAKNFALCTTEIFGAFQLIVRYKDAELPLVLQALEKLQAHLTAAVVSNNVVFQNKMLASTVNGTTYCGRRARTTGAPQNHWFGPAGDPRGAGIGTPEAIRLVWSCHREIIMDEALVGSGFQIPPCS